MPEICDNCIKRHGCMYYQNEIFERIEIRNGELFCSDKN